MPVSSESLFGDDINVRINNIGAHQKVFKVDEIYFKLGRPFDKQSFLAKQFLKNWKRFPKTLEIKQGVQMDEKTIVS